MINFNADIRKSNADLRRLSLGYLRPSALHLRESAFRKKNETPSQAEEVDFMGISLHTGEGLFTPRPETEILVEEVVKRVSSLRVSRTNYILDLCTGCGNIAIALAKFLPKARIVAVDISREAIESARGNAESNGVSERIEFIEGDLFGALKGRGWTFDVVVSNAPYIAGWEFPFCSSEVLREPRIALYGGEDGLDFYRRIIKSASDYLGNGGLLAFEVGYYQARLVEKMLAGFRDVQIVKDYSGIERVVIARQSNQNGVKGLSDNW